jgi:hypothetical protein
VGVERYRIVNLLGSEISIFEDARAQVAVGDELVLPDGPAATVVQIREDDFGRYGGVQATLVVDRPAAARSSRRTRRRPRAHDEL